MTRPIGIQRSTAFSCVEETPRKQYCTGNRYGSERHALGVDVGDDEGILW
jgi:hypothetical protein